MRELPNFSKFRIFPAFCCLFFCCVLCFGSHPPDVPVMVWHIKGLRLVSKLREICFPLVCRLGFISINHGPWDGDAAETSTHSKVDSMSRSLSGTPTPTVSASFSVSATRSESASAMITPSVSGTPTSTKSGTLSCSPTGTCKASGTATASVSLSQALQPICFVPSWVWRLFLKCEVHSNNIQGRGKRQHIFLRFFFNFFTLSAKFVFFVFVFMCLFFVFFPEGFVFFSGKFFL